MSIRSWFPVLCAFALSGSVVTAQYFPDHIVQPQAYVSPSQEYELYVDPSHRHGVGKAQYRLSRKGKQLWTREHSFTFVDALVSNDGVAAGFAYTAGNQGLGHFVVAILDSSGEIRTEHRTKREGSQFMHTSPNPKCMGMWLQDEADRFVVQVSDPDVNVQNETWWSYRLSSGELVEKQEPKSKMEDAGYARFSIEARPVPETPLVVSHWWGHEEYVWGGRFCVSDADAGVVWQLDVEADYDLESGDEEDLLQDWIKEEGAILSVGPGASFDLYFVRAGKRVRYEVSGDATDGWRVTEVSRKDYARPAETPPPASDIPEIELEVLGTVSFGTAPAQDSPVAGVFTFDVDDLGQIGVVRRPDEGQDNFNFDLFDGNGTKLSSFPLSEVGREPWPSVAMAWMRGNRWVICTSSYADDAVPSVYWVDSDSRSMRKIEGWTGPGVERVVPTPDGGFVVLGVYRSKYTRQDALAAYDPSGSLRWEVGERYEDETKLFGAEDVTVTDQGMIVVLENVPKRLKLYDLDGNYVDAVELEEVVGQVRYPTKVFAERDGGVVVVDASEPNCIRFDANLALIERVQPHYPDGNRSGLKLERISADGTWWGRDPGAFVVFDDKGKVVRFAGSPPDPEKLDEVEHVVVDHLGRVYLVDERTGVTHVFESDGTPLHRCQPKKGDFGDRVQVEWMTVRADGSLFLAARENAGIHFDPSGKRVEGFKTNKKKTGGTWTFLPGKSKRWSVYDEDVRLCSEEGDWLEILRRSPEDRWLRSPRTVALAPDGSLALEDASANLWQAPETDLHVYGPGGEPRWSQTLPAEFAMYPELAFSGAWIAVLRGEGLLLIDGDGTTLQRSALPGSFGSAFFSPDGRELWLFPYGKPSMTRFVVP